MVSIANTLMAQQKQIYEQTHTAQVLSNWGTWSRYFMGIPKGPVPGFPSWVPDSVKCGAPYFNTTDHRLYFYDCYSTSWLKVADSAAIYSYIKASIDSVLSGLKPFAELQVTGVPTTSTSVIRLKDTVGNWGYVTNWKLNATDTLIAHATTGKLDFSPTTGNTVTSSMLIGANILGVYRSGLQYQYVNSVPGDNQYTVNSATGVISFSTPFASGYSENVHVEFNNYAFVLNGQPLYYYTYNTAASIVYPIQVNAIVFIQSDENKGGIPYLYFAPKNTSSYRQLQAIATAPNNF